MTKISNEIYNLVREFRGDAAAKLFESDGHDDHESREFFYCSDCAATFSLSEVDEFIAQGAEHHGHVHALCPGCGDKCQHADVDAGLTATEMCAEEAIELYIAETAETFVKWYDSEKAEA